MTNKNSRLGPRVLQALVVVVAVCAVLYVFLPYSPDHFRHIHTVQLVGEVRDWQASYGSNADPRSLEFSRKDRSLARHETNVVHAGNPYLTFVKFEDATFRGKGYLVATREPRFFWIGRNGEIVLMYPKEEGGDTTRSGAAAAGDSGHE